MFKIQITMGRSESRYVRVVKETDSKSVGLCLRRFESCCRRFLFIIFLRLQRRFDQPEKADTKILILIFGSGYFHEENRL